MYSTSFDGTLKNAIKNRKVPEEIVEYQSFKERIEIILEHLKEEKAVKNTDVQGQPRTPEKSDDAPASCKDCDVQEAEVAPDPGAYFRSLSSKTLRSQVQLVVTPGSATAVANIVKSRSAASTLGGEFPSGYTIFLFDVKHTGECTHDARVRVSPLREDHLQKVIFGCLTGRNAEESEELVIRDRDMFVMLDGMKHGNPPPHKQSHPGSLSLTSCLSLAQGL